ncbi:shikimate dehydrogenase [Cytophagaceae bacterium DM2B3-1]|uniref:Shikimate dehydrogenase n=1 Tax=Xanthocytophaga flava TaxID=3048013 RepID=A0ABT7CI68_9BACT|nr:shikimate dehydrogenase [Xanthocytophaga flavus]MDJ1493236.1 shikimate dehydrogenase [Xanthocytophaga flavus]
MRIFGLIGYPLGHSFSKKYFTEKFAKEHITDASYELFPLEDIKLLPGLISSQPNLRGLNVTIPYKEQVIPYLTSIDPAAKRIGAVNVIKIAPDGSTTGYNSDYFGFKSTLEGFLNGNFISEGKSLRKLKALILGTGGASKAVKIALDDMDIENVYISRRAGENIFGYDDLTEKILSKYLLIINTTPLGMYPEVDVFPPLPYEWLTGDHLLYDLVYNPEQTIFLQKGAKQGAKIFGGLPMLYAQAEKSWEIWTTK